MANKTVLIFIVLSGVLGIGAAILPVIINVLIIAVLLILICLTLLSLKKIGRKREEERLREK